MSLIQQLFKRYTQQNTTPAEEDLVHEWYATYDRTTLAEMSNTEEKDTRQAIWTKLNDNLQATGDLPERPVVRMRKTWLKYATAAVVTGVSITGSIWLASRKATPQYTMIAAGAGQHKKIDLPDGTSLLLSANSEVLVPDDYNKTIREVQMPYGEVFYDVAKDSTRPFVIQSGPLTVKVLGTSFHIRLLKGLSEQEVLVKSGRVQVSNGDRVLGILTKGNRLFYDTASRQVAIQYNKERMAEQVQQGWLVFENTPYATFAAIMNSHFNIHITDPDKKLNNVRFTAAFPPTASVKDIMAVLTSIHHIQYQEVGDKLIIK